MNHNTPENKASAIQNELHAAETLLATLESEYSLLSDNPTPEAISEIAGEKVRLLLLMEQATKNRVALIATHDSLITCGPLKGQWQRLLEVAQACRTQNLANGCLINSARRHADQATAILQGTQPGSDLRYGSSGETISERPQQTLAKA